MQRIIIIGICGAGKSWLAKKLGIKLNRPVYHLDHLYWKPGWKESRPEEWHPKLKNILKENNWIIDGNFSSTLELRLKRADTVILLAFNRWIALRSAIWRSLSKLGQNREDMTPGLSLIHI